MPNNDFLFYLDYQMCIQNAQTIEPAEKSLFCLNFYYVFYAELEINMNRYFTDNSREQWSLLFVDYNFMPPIHLNNNHLPVQTFFYQPHILTILHNAKVKYCCLNCRYEWASARGRAIFQSERPEPNKYNILFAYLFTQKCQQCHQETKPSWYLDEATRVMKNVCRILMNKFYSDLHSPSSSSSTSEEAFNQRASDMRNPHHQNLCRACQEGSCYASHWQ
jgi:hypothetical protein